MFKRTHFTGTWGLKGPITVLAVFSCLLFPAVHILFPQAQKWATIIYPAYFGIVLIFLILTRHATWKQLGFHTKHWKQNLTLGCLAGGLVMGMVPLLEIFIGVSGLDQTELFSGADQRLSQESEGNTSFIAFVLPAFLIALAEQGLLTGYVLQSLIRKIKPVLAVYLGGLIFMLVHFDFHLGLFLLGMTASSFYWLTGSLVAPLMFQIACNTAGWLLAHHYPKVFTLLGFLF
jgi:membrane protease YdiL (CAAX protease family)